MSSTILARPSPTTVDHRCPRQTRLDTLLVRVGRGDREAFAEMYDELGPSVYAMTLREGQDSRVSGQVTQYVFLRAWRQAGSYDPDRTSAWAWVHALAVAAAQDGDGYVF